MHMFNEKEISIELNIYIYIHALYSFNTSSPNSREVEREPTCIILRLWFSERLLARGEARLGYEHLCEIRQKRGRAHTKDGRWRPALRRQWRRRDLYPRQGWHGLAGGVGATEWTCSSGAGWGAGRGRLGAEAVTGEIKSRASQLNRFDLIHFLFNYKSSERRDIQLASKYSIFRHYRFIKFSFKYPRSSNIINL